ncbi:hypothetical protein C8R46DRAFT_384243 [Mycena filopes]|nr:hypothetical protein C8R46DRAFT_384243 [Mycena filopes]
MDCPPRRGSGPLSPPQGMCGSCGHSALRTEKTATSALFTISAVNHFTLWVNNEPVGSSGNGTNDWQTAQVLSAALNASTNTVSILAVNNNNAGAPPPALLAAIVISYTDGTVDLVVSDSSWGVSSVFPTDFPSVSTASQFIFATVLGTYGSGSWGSLVIPATNPNSQLATLRAATWIWSLAGAAGDVPAQTVGFRKTLASPSGKTAESALILVAGDDSFQVYVNNDFVGQPPGDPVDPYYGNALLYGVDLSGAENVFTVFGINSGGPSGIAASITIQFSDGSDLVVGTDTTWLFANLTTTASDFLALPDASLASSFSIAAPAVSGLVSVSNALPAAKVPKGPFASGTLIPSPSPSPSSTGVAHSKSKSKIGVIVGPVVGVLALVALGVLVFFCLRRRRDKPSMGQQQQPYEQHPPQAQNYTATSFTSYPSHVATGGAQSSGYLQSVYPQPTQTPPGTDYDAEPWLTPEVVGTVPNDPNTYPPWTGTPNPALSSKRSEMRVVTSSGASVRSGTMSRTPPSLVSDARREHRDSEVAPPSYSANQH